MWLVTINFKSGSNLCSCQNRFNIYWCGITRLYYSKERKEKHARGCGGGNDSACEDCNLSAAEPPPTGQWECVM